MRAADACELVSAIDVADDPSNGFDITHSGLRRGRISTMLPGVAIALRRARVRATVHPAAPLAVHCRGLALRSRAGPGQTARHLGQPFRLRRIV